MIKIFGKYKNNDWEEIDECEEKDLNYLLGEYRMAYGAGWRFKTRKC